MVGDVGRNLHLLQVVNDMFKSFMTEDKILEMVSKSQEFEQIKVRFYLFALRELSILIAVKSQLNGVGLHYYT